MIFYLLDTGYTCIYSHVMPPEGVEFNKNDTIEYDPQLVIAKIGPKDKYSGFPHLHVQCQTIGHDLPNDDIWNGFNFSTRDRGMDPKDIEIADYLIEEWVN